jgi:hypothetical protein
MIKGQNKTKEGGHISEMKRKNERGGGGELGTRMKAEKERSY